MNGQKCGREDSNSQVEIRTSSNDYSTFATYCDKSNNLCRGVIIQGDGDHKKIIVTKLYTLNSSEFRGMHNVFNNFVPSESFFSDGILNTGLVDGYSLALLLGLKHIANQFSINCEISSDECSILTKTKDFAQKKHKLGGPVWEFENLPDSDVFLAGHPTCKSLLRNKTECYKVGVEKFKINREVPLEDEISINTRDMTKIVMINDWMMENDRCSCAYKHLTSYNFTLRGIEFHCDVENTQHEFKMNRPFSEQKFSFFMTNDLYAIQKNSPVKRLEWQDNKLDWKTVKIDDGKDSKSSIISCNQVEPFYNPSSEINDHAPFNLIGCLEKHLEIYRLVVYKTEIITQQNTVQWKTVVSQDLKVKNLETDHILKITVRSDPSENCFKFYMFTDSSDNNEPLLPTLNLTGNLSELLLAEFNKFCLNFTTGNQTKKSSLALNTHLCTRTIALRYEIIPTDHGFITYDYANSIFSTVFTTFDDQLQELLKGFTLTGFHQYHPDEMNELNKSEKTMYSLVPPLANMNAETHHDLKNICNTDKFIDIFKNSDCDGNHTYVPPYEPSDYCPFDYYTGLRSDGGNMQFTCEHGYVCTNSEYWCYSNDFKHRIYRWFDDLYPKNCRTELACNTTIIMGETAHSNHTIHIEDCVKKYNERKHNFFASKTHNSTFVNTDSECMIDAFKKKSYEVVINEFEKSVDPSDTGLSTHWNMIFILLSIALVMVILVFYLKLFNVYISRKTDKKQNDLKLTDYSKVDKSDNVYVHKESQLSDSDGIQIRKKSFFYEKCLQGCRHTDDCVKTEIKIILVKRMMDYFKLKYVAWIPGVREYISLRNTYFYLKELDDFVESNVDDLAKFNYQKVQGYYVHLATNLKKNEDKHTVSKMGNTEDFELDNLMNVESNNHVSLNSSLDKTDDCALVVILEGEPSELFRNIFDLQCVQNHISFGLNSVFLEICRMIFGQKIKKISSF